jgi:hypothetical protein
MKMKLTTSDALENLHAEDSPDAEYFSDDKEAKPLPTMNTLSIAESIEDTFTVEPDTMEDPVFSARWGHLKTI